MSSLCFAVPSFISAGVFCISPNGSRNSEFLRTCTRTQRVFFLRISLNIREKQTLERATGIQEEIWGSITHIFFRDN